MKKSLLLLSLASVLFASPQGDVSLTVGHNIYDNDDLFKGSTTFLGIRGGIQLDKYLGLQLGYEQADNVICDDCNTGASRLYANILREFNMIAPITPYILAGLGYEMLEDDWYGDDQLYGSIGVGARYAFTNEFGLFLDGSFIHKFDVSETDFITRAGLSYRFNNKLTPIKTVRYQEQKVSTFQPQRRLEVESNYTHKIPAPYMETMNIKSTKRDTYVEPIILDEVIDDSIQIADIPEGKHYIQLMALAKTSPETYMQKLNSKGIYNLSVKEIIRGNRSLSIIVAGPYIDKQAANVELPKLRRYSSGAFVKRFD